MSGPDSEENPERRKRTVWLLAGGAASLILPALGAVYLIRGGSGASGPTGRSDVFERRDTGEKRLVPTQTVVPPSALASPSPAAASLSVGGGKVEQPATSSLDFIKPGAELSAKVAEAPKPATATTSAPAAATTVAAPAAPAAPAAKTPAKKGKKDFVMPKLQPTRGFSQMGGSRSSSSSATKGSAPAAGGGDSQDLLKNLPPDAANNPQLQQYLKQQGK